MDTSIAIVGIGRTPFSRSSGRTTLAMAADASRSALRDAGLGSADVDGIATFQVLDSAPPVDVAYALGIDDLTWSADLYGGGNVLASTIGAASAAIASGRCEVALVYRSLNGRSGIRFGVADGTLEVGGLEQFGGPHGVLVPAQWIAIMARRHQHVYGTTNEDLGQIAVTQRSHAMANPHAIARTPLSLDDYLDSRLINEPFHVYDCSYEVDGAVALVLTSGERARDLAQRPVWLVDVTESHAGGGWERSPDMTTMYSANAASRLWGRTGYGPTDIDVACMYDCFTYTVMATMEDFGFCEKGGVGEFFGKGKATYGGDVVVNPHGGLLSEGYLHGLNHHYEAALQLRGQAGARQVPDARVVLTTGGVGPFGGAVLYSRDAA
jgi:acetyl-CoA acetyltransferase